MSDDIPKELQRFPGDELELQADHWPAMSGLADVVELKPVHGKKHEWLRFICFDQEEFVVPLDKAR